MKVLTHMLLSGIVVLLVLPVVSGQTRQSPSSCELASAYLDSILERTGPTDILIVVSRLGSRERNQKLNTRRLHNLRAYLGEYKGETVFKTSPRNLVLAVGEKTRDLGSLEIYLKNSLFATIYVGHNRDLFIGECAIDLDEHSNPCEIAAQKVFYPCRGSRR